MSPESLRVLRVVFLFSTATTSVQWYSWNSGSNSSSSYQSHNRLCQSCWVYWKKYGDLTVQNKPSSALQASSDDDSKSVGGAEALTSRPHRCAVQGCGKVNRCSQLAKNIFTFVFFSLSFYNLYKFTKKIKKRNSNLNPICCVIALWLTVCHFLPVRLVPW